MGHSRGGSVLTSWRRAQSRNKSSGLTVGTSMGVTETWSLGGDVRRGDMLGSS